MTDQNPEAADDAAGAADESQTDSGDSGKTYPADYVSKLRRESARYREQAKENAAAAEELAKLRDEQKTADERATEREAAAKQQLEAIPALVAKELRTYLIDMHQIDDEDAELFLTAQSPELLRKQVERLNARRGGRANNVPREGTNPKPAPANEAAAFAKQLFTGTT
jgi:hypothetical protein